MEGVVRVEVCFCRLCGRDGMWGGFAEVVLVWWL